MVERVLTDHYFVTAENGEFSESVDITDADTFSATVDSIWPTDKLEDGETPGNWGFGRAWKRQLGHTIWIPHRRFMKYRQLDRIVTLEPGQRIVAQRTLREDEEYLKDHFPRFPVMPGVMMLESLHQAAVWMIHTGDEFSSPLVLLREVRNAKFGDFLSPGQTLQVTAEKIKEKDGLVTVKAQAEKDGRVTVSARLILERSGSNEPEETGTDEDVRWRAQKQFKELFGDILFTSDPTT